MINKLSRPTKYGLISLCAIGLQAQAEVNISGFASMRATTIDSDTGASPTFRFQNAEGDISFKDESLFGLQVSADLGDGLTATAQLLAEGQNDFEVAAQWAYLNYQINDSHQLKVGRLANPLFRQSQYQDVGYAHNYGRLPISVYGDFPFDVIEGLSLDSIFFIGDNTLETKLFYGNFDETSPVGTNVLKDEMGFNITYGSDWWQIFGGFLAVEASEGTEATEVDFTYGFAGFAVDYNNFLVELEVVTYESDDERPAITPPGYTGPALPVVTAGTTDAYYASVGYRLDDVIVTLHHESLDNDGTFLPNEQAGSGITVRYDFHPSAALKVDYYSGDQKRGPFEPAVPAAGNFDALSVGVDLVF